MNDTISPPQRGTTWRRGHAERTVRSVSERTIVFDVHSWGITIRAMSCTPEEWEEWARKAELVERT